MPDSSSFSSNKLFFTLHDLTGITGKGYRTLERHLERGELQRASPPKKKILVAREELLIFIDKMHRGLL
jgi:hypothetical protein